MEQKTIQISKILIFTVTVKNLERYYTCQYTVSAATHLIIKKFSDMH